MRSDRLALYTTVYPASVAYLPAWHASVLAQTDQHFDLWIALDGLSAPAVAQALGCTPDARFIEMAPGLSPAGIRSAALSQLSEQYPAIICVDSDDVLAPSRVQAARMALAEADLSACALDLVDVTGGPLNITMCPPPGADPVALLPRVNVFGLSNTAYRSAALRRCLPLPAACVLADWLIATRAWASGAQLAFDAAPRMQYRQHDGNIAGFTPPFVARNVMRATQLVLDHYDHLATDSWPLPTGIRDRISAERARVTQFHSAMRRDPLLLQRYVEHLNELPPVRMWWWHVAHDGLEDMWNN